MKQEAGWQLHSYDTGYIFLLFAFPWGPMKTSDGHRLPDPCWETTDLFQALEW